MNVSPKELAQMVDHLYRFRSIENLLGKQELENQEIFFAHPENLNDPTEGVQDIFWRGDLIVWTNLIKHYLVCLNTAWCLLALCGEENHFGWDNIPINYLHGQSLNLEQKAIHSELFTKFFSIRNVRPYIKLLADRGSPIRRNELAAHLRNLHMLAISTIHEFYAQKHPSSNPAIPPKIRRTLGKVLSAAKKATSLMQRLEAEHPNHKYATEAFYTGRRLLTNEMGFINLYNETVNPAQRNKIFVFLDFPDTYVDQIEKLVYPHWYAACFMEDSRNASVWGNYGVNHTGVCLKFKVHNSNGLPNIRLRRICGFSGSEHVYGQIDHTFYKINYHRPLVPIDFCRSIARVPIPMVRRYWYQDEQGRQSPCAGDMLNSGTTRRRQHWRKFYKSVTRKTLDWRYEREHRLVLSADMLDFADPNTRKARYDFADLEGIIFGIKTSTDNKREICKIIETKCRETDRYDFQFYQAFYAPQKGTIEQAEMRLLKFKH